jgi:hypothetical protein
MAFLLPPWIPHAVGLWTECPSFVSQSNNILAGRWWTSTGAGLFTEREAQKRALEDLIEEDEEEAAAGRET